MKQIFTLLISLTFLGTLCYGQSLRGKPIYVSNTDEVRIKFKSSIDNYSFVNKVEANRFNIKVYGSKNVVITSTAANFKTATLVITEGENTHLFILEFKDRLSQTETVYDYSTREKLYNESQLLAKGIKGVPEKDKFVNYVTSASDLPTTTASPATLDTIIAVNEAISTAALSLNQFQQPSLKETKVQEPKFQEVKTEETVTKEVARPEHSFQVAQPDKNPTAPAGNATVTNPPTPNTQPQTSNVQHPTSNKPVQQTNATIRNTKLTFAPEQSAEAGKIENKPPSGPAIITNNNNELYRTASNTSTSNFQPQTQTSNLQPPTSNLQPQPQTSNLQPQTSNNTSNNKEYKTTEPLYRTTKSNQSTPSTAKKEYKPDGPLYRPLPKKTTMSGSDGDKSITITVTTVDKKTKQ